MGIRARNQAAKDARLAKHFQAWQTLNSATGKPGNAGRADALEDLNGDGVNLDNVDLSGGAILAGPLSLTNARLSGAILNSVTISNADFSSARLHDVSMTNANINSVTFSNADLYGVNLSDSIIRDADFCNADLGVATLSFSIVERVNFAGANMAGAQFGSRPVGKGMPNTVFEGCNFAGADLSDIDGAEGEGIVMRQCNVYQLFTLSNVLTRARSQGKNVEVNITNQEWLIFLKTNKW